MTKTEIEQEVRRLQVEIWSWRTNLFPMGIPKPEAMFEPRVVADVLGVSLEFRDRLEAHTPSNHSVTAGQLDRDRNIISVSTAFGYPTQRFTAAHEIGHFLLHPSLGSNVVHRDRPIFDIGQTSRPPMEQDADYYAACLLIPRKSLETQFVARFGTKKPLPLTETTAFFLSRGDTRQFFCQPKGSLHFALAVAQAQSFDTRRFPSLADYFGVSNSALAIRLVECGLVSA